MRAFLFSRVVCDDLFAPAAGYVYYCSNTVDYGYSLLFRFELAASSATPLYRQIVDQVERAIVGQTLREGDELPSVRAVAETHAINPMTVSKAYALLEQRGAIERRKGLGMYVRAHNRSVQDARSIFLPTISETVSIAQQLGFSKSEAVELFSEQWTCA